MQRGDIWTVSGGPDHAGTPRPVVIIQDDRFDATAALTICAFTSDATDGLHAPSRMMVNKITTVPKSKLGTHIGRLDAADMVRLAQAMLLFLGLAESPRAGRQAG